jgi:hypothetical protein
VAALRFAEAGMPLVQVLNYSIGTDKQWTDRFEETLVRKQLAAISSNIAAGVEYPSVGGHCDSCLSQACKEVFSRG